MAAAMLTWAVETWLRYLVTQLRADSRVSENPRGSLNQDATLLLTASRDLWSAQSQREIIEIVMRSGIGLLGASGASFTTLDEWEQQTETLTIGVVPSGKDDDWPSRLVHASTRQACRNCNSREAGSDCILGKDIVGHVSKVFCLPIKRGDRDFGLVNFFFLAPVTVDELQKWNLYLLSEYAKLALENHHQMKQGVAALHHLELSRAKKEFTSFVLDITEDIKRELNVKSVTLWGPPGEEHDFASKLLSSSFMDREEIGLVNVTDFVMELWHDLMKSNRPFSRDFDDAQGKRVSLLVVPIEGATKSPIGMMVCGCDSPGRNIINQLPIFKLAALSIGTILQSIQLVDQMEYRAARDERFRLAREIHDGLAQTLAYLKIQTAQMLNYLNSGKLDNLETSLTSTYQTLSAAYQDARREIDDLRFVPQVGTQEWLIDLALGFRDDTGTEVDVSRVQINVPLPLAIQSQLIRIVQEALNNIRQHAQAEKVFIAGSVQGGEVFLEISDDGLGFEPETVNSGSRYGLVGMRERTDMIGGEFQIISLPDKGTTVRITIPLESMNRYSTPGNKGE